MPERLRNHTLLWYRDNTGSSQIRENFDQEFCKIFMSPDMKKVRRTNPMTNQALQEPAEYYITVLQTIRNRAKVQPDINIWNKSMIISSAITENIPEGIK